MRTRFFARALIVAGSLLIAWAGSARAAILQASNIFPTGTYLSNGGSGPNGPSSTYVSPYSNSNTASPAGQTFTSGAPAVITAITMLTDAPSHTATSEIVNFYSVGAAGALTPLDSETFSVPSFGNGPGNPIYLTATLANPVELTASSQYAFSFSSVGGTMAFNDWNDNRFAGGGEFSSTTVATPDATHDYVFYLNYSSVLPEPAAVGGLGLLALFLRRRR